MLGSFDSLALLDYLETYIMTLFKDSSTIHISREVSRRCVRTSNMNSRKMNSTTAAHWCGASATLKQLTDILLCMSRNTHGIIRDIWGKRSEPRLLQYKDPSIFFALSSCEPLQARYLCKLRGDISVRSGRTGARASKCSSKPQSTENHGRDGKIEKKLKIMEEIEN